MTKCCVSHFFQKNYQILRFLLLVRLDLFAPNQIMRYSEYTNCLLGLIRQKSVNTIHSWFEFFGVSRSIQAAISFSRSFGFAKVWPRKSLANFDFIQTNTKQCLGISSKNFIYCSKFIEFNRMKFIGPLCFCWFYCNWVSLARQQTHD